MADGKIIAGHELVPGKIFKDYIHVKGTQLHIPYVLFCGKYEGPTVLVMAGIHSAEYIGIQAAIELSNELEVDSLRGNVVIIPLANRSGFESRTMSMVFEDGKNLNRVFPGDAGGSEADRLADMLYKVFISNVDYYIDLHSGDGYETLIPYTYFLGDTPVEKQSREMAECVNTKYCVRSECRTGGAYNIASLHGVPSILIERGQLSLLNRQEIDMDKEDVYNILRRIGILSGTYTVYPKLELMENSDDAPYTGCWYPNAKVGETFHKGQKLGEIRDYFGRILFTEIAHNDGILLHQCSSLSIIANGPMITYGMLQPMPI